MIKKLSLLYEGIYNRKLIFSQIKFNIFIIFFIIMRYLFIIHIKKYYKIITFIYKNIDSHVIFYSKIR